MSGKATGMVWELDLPHAQQFVLLAMADHADQEGAKIFPSVADIAWKTGYSDRQVRRIIKIMRDSSVLELTKANYGKYGTNCYRINWDKAPKKPIQTRPDILSSPDKKTQGDDKKTPPPDIQMSSDPSDDPSSDPSKKTIADLAARDLQGAAFYIILENQQQILNVPIDPRKFTAYTLLTGKEIKSDPRLSNYKRVLTAPLPVIKEELERPPSSETPPIDYPEPTAPKTQPHVALIEAWHYSIPEDLRPIGKPVIDRNCPVAMELKEAGIKPWDVVRFVTCTYGTYREWAVRNKAPKVMTLEHVKKFIPSFMAKEPAKEKTTNAINSTGRPHLRGLRESDFDDDSESILSGARAAGA